MPGIGRQWSDQSLEGVARQIAKALDLADTATDARYETALQLADFGGRSNKVCRISRRPTHDATPEPVIDVLEMDYRPALTKWFEEKAILAKCLYVFLAILTAGARFVRGKFAPRNEGKRIKTRGEQVQLMYASFILLLLSCYLFLLVLAAWAAWTGLGSRPPGSPPPNTAATATSRTNADGSVTSPTPAAASTNTNLASATNRPAGTNSVGTSNAPSDPSPPPGPGSGGIAGSLTTLYHSGTAAVAGARSAVFRASPFLFVLATLLGVAAPDKWKGMIEGAAADYVCLLHYMSYGTRRNAIVGQFSDFVEGYAEWAKDRQPRIHVFAYSFGSIIALDTLFPAGAGPAARVRQVRTLVSIGCPFDVLRMTWPGYFSGRTSGLREGELRRWLNLYSSNDVISSNFRNDELEEVAEETVQCTQGKSPLPPENVPYKEGAHSQDLSFFETLMLMGLRSHATYWEPGNATERNCFTYIIDRMPDLGR